jgi:hypothetical protein
MSRPTRPTESPYGQRHQPQRQSDDTDVSDNEASTFDAPIDDPGDAQRTSKSEPDGDGEEGV